MSTSCSTSATSTSTDVITSSSVSTSFSQSVTTLPGTPSVVLGSTCAVFTTSNSSTSCVSSTTTSSTTTVGGEVTTIQVPFATTIFVTQTEFSTFYGSSCTVLDDGGKSSAPSPSPTPAVVATTTTPPPTTFTSQISSTLADGGVTVQVITVTSTQPPTSGLVTLNSSATSLPVTTSKTNIAPIVGGVVGGICGITVIALIIWFIMKRRRRWDDIFDDSEIDAALAGADSGPHPRKNRFSAMATTDIEPEPKPYQYGYVGNTLTSAQYNSLPQSPPDSAASRSSTVRSMQTINGASPNGPASAYLQTPAGVYQQQQLNNGHPARPTSMTSVSSGGFAPISPPGVPVSPPQSSWGGAAAMGAIGIPVQNGNANEDYFNHRVGSPVSFSSEGRKLQVVNGQRMSSMSVGPYLDLRSGEGVILEEDPSSSQVMNTEHDRRNSRSHPKSNRTSVRSTSAGGVLVHTDGGSTTNGTSATDGPANQGSAPLPPAYEE